MKHSQNQWHYHTTEDKDGEDIRTAFQPISPPEIKQELKVSQVETIIEAHNQERVEEAPLPKFRPHPNIRKPYNFYDEVV